MIDFARAAFRDENPEDAEPPEQIGYLWQWFNDLTDWRECGFSIGALSHQEIESWARLFCLDISPFEVDILRRLDREFRVFQNEKNEEPAAVNIGEQMRSAVAQGKRDGR